MSGRRVVKKTKTKRSSERRHRNENSSTLPSPTTASSIDLLCKMAPQPAAPQHRCHSKRMQRETVDESDLVVHTRPFAERSIDVGATSDTESVFAPRVRPDEKAKTALLDREVVELNTYLTSAQESCDRYYKAADAQRRKHNLSTWIVLCLMSATSTGSTFVNFFVPQTDSETTAMYAFRITVNVLLAFATVIQAWQTAYKPEWKAMNHEMSGDDFANYIREWRMRIVQGIDDRRERVMAALVTARFVLREIESAALPLPFVG